MFIVIEIQKSNGQIATIVNAYDDIKDAKARYHTILAAAAKSGLERHGAVILSESGATIANESYVTEGEAE